MYKAFLALRYLRTRYIALASILSVMLGVATMIVVNSVMKGFTSEMRSRIQGLLSDIVIETNSLDGAENAHGMFRQIRSVAGNKVKGMTATVEVWGLITFPFAGQYTTRPITLIGIEPEEKATVGPFKEYLESYHPLLDGKKLVRPPLRSPKQPAGWELTSDALAWRKQIKQQQKWLQEHLENSHDSPPDESATKSSLTTVSHTESDPASRPGGCEFTQELPLAAGSRPGRKTDGNPAGRFERRGSVRPLQVEPSATSGPRRPVPGQTVRRNGPHGCPRDRGRRPSRASTTRMRKRAKPAPRKWSSPERTCGSAR